MKFSLNILNIAKVTNKNLDSTREIPGIFHCICGLIVWVPIEKFFLTYIFNTKSPFLDTL